MRKTYLVYSTDAWHSYASRDVIGVGTSIPNCFKVIREHIRKYGHDKLTEDNKFELEHYRQTQGRETNYFIEEVEKNVLL